MTTTVMTSTEWAFGEWSGLRLGDARLERRAIAIGTDVLQNLFESCPKMFKAPSKTKAFYRFLHSRKVSRTCLIRHHLARTRWNMMLQDVVLNIQDATTVAYPHRCAIEDLYDVGNVEGFVVHNTIGVVPTSTGGAIQGLVHQSVIHRKPRAQRTAADNEILCWLDGIRAAPSSKNIIDVMDRGADALVVMHASLTQGHQFLLRAKHDRTLENCEQSLFSYARALPVAGTMPHRVQGRPGKPARETTLMIRYGEVHLAAAKNDHRTSGLQCFVVHVGELTPPTKGEPLEWFLLTSITLTSFEDALTIVRYYSYRWVVEEYHKCLKTGFRLELTQLQSLKGIENLLGFISVASIELLRLRDLAREQPTTPARDLVEQEDINLVAGFYNRDNQLTIGEFLRYVAQMGGFLGSKKEYPGWQTIWSGWKYLQTLKEGVRLYKKGCG